MRLLQRLLVCLLLLLLPMLLRLSRPGISYTYIIVIINCMIEKTCDYKVPLCGTHNYKSLVSSQSFGIDSYLYISNENEIALDVISLNSTFLLIIGSIKPSIIALNAIEKFMLMS